jgi:hypothetical protein
MKAVNAQASTYPIEGEFLEFIPMPGDEFKYMQFRVGERIIPIKLAKELRETLGRQLVEGERLRVFLEQAGYQLKLKTHYIERLDADKSRGIEPICTPKRGKILLCSKSSCAKRGGKQLYYALTETLKQLGLQDQVTIELTGCQKQCKQAPSLVLMPGGVRHAYVHPYHLAALLEAYYC